MHNAECAGRGNPLPQKIKGEPEESSLPSFLWGNEDETDENQNCKYDNDREQRHGKGARSRPCPFDLAGAYFPRRARGMGRILICFRRARGKGGNGAGG